MTMKRLLLSKMAALLIIIVATVAAQARTQTPQEEGGRVERSLKLMVRNPRGKVIRDMMVAAQVKGRGETEQLDRFGNSFFRVADGDTIIMLTGGDIYEFPVAGFDSLYVVFRNPKRIAGVRSGRGDELINIGYGTTSRRNNTSSVSTLDMDGAGIYTDLKSYMEGRVAGVNFDANGQLIIRGINSINSGVEALVVVDGVAMPSFSVVNQTLNIKDVASISVLKDAGSAAIYGSRGANGVVLISTRSGGARE